MCRLSEVCEFNIAIANGDDMSERRKMGSCINKSFKQIMSFKKLYLIISFGIKILQGVIPAVNVIILQRIFNIIQEEKSGLRTLILYITVYVLMHESVELVSLLYMQ